MTETLRLSLQRQFNDYALDGRITYISEEFHLKFPITRY
jgi:hypothetical protein